MDVPGQTCRSSYIQTDDHRDEGCLVCPVRDDTLELLGDPCPLCQGESISLHLHLLNGDPVKNLNLQAIAGVTMVGEIKRELPATAFGANVAIHHGEHIKPPLCLIKILRNGELLKDEDYVVPVGARASSAQVRSEEVVYAGDEETEKQTNNAGPLIYNLVISCGNMEEHVSAFVDHWLRAFQELVGERVTKRGLGSCPTWFSGGNGNSSPAQLSDLAVPEAFETLMTEKLCDQNYPGARDAFLTLAFLCSLDGDSREENVENSEQGQAHEIGSEKSRAGPVKFNHDAWQKTVVDAFQFGYDPITDGVDVSVLDIVPPSWYRGLHDMFPSMSEFASQWSWLGIHSPSSRAEYQEALREWNEEDEEDNEEDQENQEH